MATNQMFQHMQPWMDMVNTMTTKIYDLNSKAIENMSKINMDLATECANTFSKCAQDMSNPKDFAAMPSKMSAEFNSLTQQVVEHNKRSLDAAIHTANEYRQLSQKMGQEMMDMCNSTCSESKTATSSVKKAAQ